MAQSKFVSSTASSDAAKAELAGAALESDALPDESQWEAVRAHARSLQASFDDMREQCRQARRRVNEREASDPAGGKRSRSVRSRRFGARVTVDTTGAAQRLLAKVSDGQTRSSASSPQGRPSERFSLTSLPSPIFPHREGVHITNPLAKAEERRAHGFGMSAPAGASRPKQTAGSSRRENLVARSESDSQATPVLAEDSQPQSSGSTKARRASSRAPRQRLRKA